MCSESSSGLFQPLIKRGAPNILSCRKPLNTEVEVIGHNASEGLPVLAMSEHLIKVSFSNF